MIFNFRLVNKCPTISLSFKGIKIPCTRHICIIYTKKKLTICAKCTEIYILRYGFHSVHLSIFTLNIYSQYKMGSVCVSLAHFGTPHIKKDKTQNYMSKHGGINKLWFKISKDDCGKCNKQPHFARNSTYRRSQIILSSIELSSHITLSTY